MYAVIRDEATYAINFTFDKGMNSEERIDAANPVLSTWYWE